MDHLIEPPRGRAAQMNAGADAAGWEPLWLLHADYRVPWAIDNLPGVYAAEAH